MLNTHCKHASIRDNTKGKMFWSTYFEWRYVKNIFKKGQHFFVKLLKFHSNNKKHIWRSENMKLLNTRILQAKVKSDELKK